MLFHNAAVIFIILLSTLNNAQIDLCNVRYFEECGKMFDTRAQHIEITEKDVDKLMVAYQKRGACKHVLCKVLSPITMHKNVLNVQIWLDAHF